MAGLDCAQLRTCITLPLATQDLSQLYSQNFRALRSTPMMSRLARPVLPLGKSSDRVGACEAKHSRVAFNEWHTASCQSSNCLICRSCHLIYAGCCNSQQLLFILQTHLLCRQAHAAKSVELLTSS